MARSGRRPGEPGTRERIEAAARTAFAELGYEGATIRVVAARAEVDPALVHHYFGTKQRLFLSVMSLPVDMDRVFESILAGPREGIGRRFVGTLLRLWRDPTVLAVMIGLVRSATTEPGAADLLRDMLGRQGIFAFVAAVAPDDAEQRAMLVGTQVIGLAMARHVIGVEPLRSADPEWLAAAIGPTIERYLTGSLGEADGHAPEPAPTP